MCCKQRKIHGITLKVQGQARLPRWDREVPFNQAGEGA